MIREASDGWLIQWGERIFYHLNEEWLDEMYRHQVKPYGNNPAYNRLRVAFNSGADADEIGEKFKDFIENRKKPAKKASEPSEFQKFIKEQRANRQQAHT